MFYFCVLIVNFISSRSLCSPQPEEEEESVTKQQATPTTTTEEPMEH